jgi:hypothetical protein
MAAFWCYNDNEDCEEVVVDKIVEKPQKTTEGQETERNGTIEHEGSRVQTLILR